MKIGKLEITWTGNRLKIGTFEFVWTRNRIIAAAIVVLVIVGLIALRPSDPVGDTTVVQLSPLPTSNIQLTAAQQQQVDLMSRGAMLFVFFHETGHMLISELKLPATGPEEDVADEFAAFFLTDMMKAAPDNQKDLFASVVFSGAIFWRMMAQDRGNGPVNWADEHSPDIKRYFNILCIATGADPVRFIPMAVRDGVDEARLQRCAADYAKKHAAWDALLEPHVKGFFAKLMGSGGHMQLQYGPSLKPEWLAFEQVYRNGGFFQTVLNALTDNLDIPDDVPVIVKGCNVENAWWSPDTKTITMCHDFFAVLVNTFARHIVADQNGGGQAGGDGGGAPPQQQPPQQQPPQAPPQDGGGGDIAQAIVGNWQCQVATSSGPAQEQDSFLANGEFSARSVFANGATMAMWGTWSLSGPNTLHYNIAGANPPGPGPMQIDIPFQMTQPGVIRTSASTCEKMG